MPDIAGIPDIPGMPVTSALTLRQSPVATDNAGGVKSLRTPADSGTDGAVGASAAAGSSDTTGSTAFSAPMAGAEAALHSDSATGTNQACRRKKRSIIERLVELAMPGVVLRSCQGVTTSAGSGIVCSSGRRTRNAGDRRVQACRGIARELVRRGTKTASIRHEWARHWRLPQPLSVRCGAVRRRALWEGVREPRRWRWRQTCEGRGWRWMAGRPVSAAQRSAARPCKRRMPHMPNNWREGCASPMGFATKRERCRRSRCCYRDEACRTSHRCRRTSCCDAWPSWTWRRRALWRRPSASNSQALPVRNACAVRP